MIVCIYRYIYLKFYIILGINKMKIYMKSIINVYRVLYKNDYMDRYYVYEWEDLIF